MKSTLLAVALGGMALSLALPGAAEETNAPPPRFRLPHIFGDNMVLQQGQPLPVWGWAPAGAKVTVAFAGQTKTATADAAGAWSVRLEARAADKTSRDLSVATADTTLVFTNVVVGEVWVCSGQSNMEWPLGAVVNASNEVAAAITNPCIRHIKVLRTHSSAPLNDFEGQWVTADANTAGAFTAVGYFFARELNQALGVPVGLIGANWGGTRIEPWTCPEGFRSVPALSELAAQAEALDPTSEAGNRQQAAFLAQVKDWLPRAEADVAARRAPPAWPTPPDTTSGFAVPTCLYNAMIRPLIPFAIQGAIWYQGESNGNEGLSYFHKMQALINGWRAKWERPLPFYYVQLANYQTSKQDTPGGETNGWARLREAQLQSLAITNTGMAVIIDIGDAVSIHPANKQDVGRRLALWALAKTYGKKDLVYSGPLYKSFALEEGKIRISFDSVGSGLMVGRKAGLAPTEELPDGVLKGFAVADKEQRWFWADAVIDDEAVVVSCPAVAEPVAVRYGFNMNPAWVNLYNREGLPASPFRTDDW